MRTCTKCKEAKPITEYYKQTFSKDGYKTVCKECVKKYTRVHLDYRNPNPPPKTYDDYLREAGLLQYRDNYIKHFS